MNMGKKKEDEQNTEEEKELLKFPNLSKKKPIKTLKFSNTVPLSHRLFLMIMWDTFIVVFFLLLYEIPSEKLNVASYFVLLFGIIGGCSLLAYKNAKLEGKYAKRK